MFNEILESLEKISNSVWELSLKDGNFNSESGALLERLSMQLVRVKSDLEYTNFRYGVSE